MLRGAAVVATTALVVALAGPALAQEGVDVLEPVVAYLSADSGNGLELITESEPSGGALVTEETGDFEHMTGESPRFTPNYLDIRRGAFFEVRPGEAPMFGSTNSSSLWDPTGHREIETEGGRSFHTYTGNIPQDGSQYEGGALLFEIDLREAPPADPGGRCDFTIWIHDAGRGGQFQSHPDFPLDPAAGSNLAFGLRLTPEGGGIPTTFSLATGEDGIFQPSDTDVRALLVDEAVGIFVPRGAVVELAAVNYYAVCWTGDSAVDPATSGADQTGAVPAGLGEAGVVSLAEAAPVAAPTTAATATTLQPTTSVVPDPIADSASGVGLWAPAAAGVVVLGSVAYWFSTRRRNPEERALAAWQKAEQSLATAEAEAESLVVACLQAGAVLEELEHERVDMCRVWPPVCLTDDEVDGGEGLSTGDRHFRRMALGELWADYKEGKIGVEEVEARWRQVNTPEFRDRMRESNDAYQETLAQLDDEIADARAATEQVCARGASAAARVDSAHHTALSARDAYHAAVESPPVPPVPVSRLVEDSDQVKTPTVVPDGQVERFRINVGFMLTIGRFAGKERNLERGERIVLELEGLLHELGLAETIDGARHGGLHAPWSGHEYEPGYYWVTGRGVAPTGPEGGPVLDGEAEPEEPPGPIPSLTHFPASIGEHATARITDWITGFDTLTMQRTFFHQLITARPYVIWERKGGTWDSRERVWRIEVGDPLRNRGEVRWFSASSSARRAQFETEANRLVWVATGVVTRDLRGLLRWRADRLTGVSH